MKDDPRVPFETVETHKSTHLGPDPGRAMEVILKSRLFVGKRFFIPLGFYDKFDGFYSVGHRIRPNVESEYGSSSPCGNLKYLYR